MLRISRRIVGGILRNYYQCIAFFANENEEGASFPNKHAKGASSSNKEEEGAFSANKEKECAFSPHRSRPKGLGKKKTHISNREGNLNLLKAFKEENGHTQLPYGKDVRNPLAIFMMNCYASHGSKLSQVDYNELEDIDFIFGFKKVPTLR